MKYKFPTLTGDQVALMRADAETGILLDEDFNTFDDKSKGLYTVFATNDEAIKYIQQVVRKQRGTEAIVYSSETVVSHYYNPFDK
jgi:hypothetical protein